MRRGADILLLGALLLGLVAIAVLPGARAQGDPPSPPSTGGSMTTTTSTPPTTAPQGPQIP